ncbi:hypothetical protein VFPBJ_11197 [Purpureocillium lilacinum]|uniref:Uncharacterized protein n=1 Tax=Purpureocillium lilacinum TaxID=33203 RepID=A0A179FJK2_PURLI|nr:hypothetical protein VFPBJ_11197 [Purpureocillium lilacinum]
MLKGCGCRRDSYTKGANLPQCFLVSHCGQFCLPHGVYSVQLIYRVGVVGHLWVLVPCEDLLPIVDQLLICGSAGEDLIHATTDGVLNLLFGVIASGRHIADSGK